MPVIEALPQPLGRNEFVDAMVGRMAGKRHSDYPMVKAIARGSATREQIGYLGILFYHFTKWTPQVLSTIHSRCEDRRIRRRLMDTLIDEDTELRCGSDRKSTRLNSSHLVISYAVFCLKKKKETSVMYLTKIV